jgi:hypothetical protein
MSKPAFASKPVLLSLAALGLSLAPLAAVAAPPSLPGPQHTDRLNLDVYALRGPQDQSAKLYLSAIAPNPSDTLPDQFEKVWVEVSTPGSGLHSLLTPHKPTVYSNIDAPNGQAVIDLGNIPLSDVVSVQAEVSTGQPHHEQLLLGRTAVTEFAVNPHNVVVPDFEGFGAQMNGYVYTAQNDPTRGFTGNEPPADIENLEAKVKDMKPGLSRIFLSPAAYLPGNQNLMDSVYKTVDLAQRAGADVNITWWFIDRAAKDDPTVQQQLMQQDMQEFASTLIDLVVNHKYTVIKQITIQNEVNTSWVKPELYEQYYRLLDLELRNAGIREQIKFVGGDLVINNQSTWFTYMAEHMGDVLDGWSVHIYWNYWDAEYFQSRLSGILAIYNSIPVAERKPLFITEYGVRGIKTLNGKTIMDVDPYRKGALTATIAGYYQDPTGAITPVNETNIAAFQQAWFNMVSVNDGFAGMSKWDFFRAQYDFTYQDHSLIGYIFNPQPGQDQWPLRPAYYMEWLMANTTGQHWQVLGQSGTSGAKLITPFRSPNGDLTLFALSSDNNAGTVTVGDLPPLAEFHVLLWNADGSGKVTDGGHVNAGLNGTVTIAVPAGGMAALTTMQRRDHFCGFLHNGCSLWPLHGIGDHTH